MSVGLRLLCPPDEVAIFLFLPNNSGSTPCTGGNSMREVRFRVFAGGIALLPDPKVDESVREEMSDKVRTHLKRLMILSL